VRVDALHGRDRVGHEVVEVQVEELGGVAALAGLDPALEPCRPELHLPAGHVGRIHAVLEDGAEARDQAAVGVEHPGRIPVGLHDAGVGVDVEEGVEMAHVDRVLEQPAPHRIGGADGLHQLAVTAVGGSQVGPLVPGRVGGHAGVHLEAVVGEVLGHQVAALLWPVGHHEVDGLEGGVGRVHGFDLGHRGPKVRVGVPLPARRTWLGALGQPVLQRLQLRVPSQQVVERRAAGANHAADHEGSPDLVLQQLRVLPPHRLGVQPLAEQIHDVGARGHAPVVVETRLFVVGAQQYPQPLEVGRIAEVVAALASAGLFVQGLFGCGEGRPGVAERSVGQGLASVIPAAGRSRYSRRRRRTRARRTADC
jgi:hypothetical protein